MGNDGVEDLSRIIMTLLAGLPCFARDSCSIIMSICAFHFYIIYFHFFYADHALPPGLSRVLIVFSLCPFPDESVDMCQMLCQFGHPFSSYSRFLNF